MSSFQSSSKVYRLSMLKAVFPPAAVCAVVLIVFVLLGRPEQVWYVFPMLILSALILAWTVWLNAQTVLELTQQGLVFNTAGFCIQAGWQDLAGCGRRLVGSNFIEVLVLKRPVMQIKPWLNKILEILPVLRVFVLAQGRCVSPDPEEEFQDIIPVGLFFGNWRNSTIGEMLQQYAPQVLTGPVR
jgi:hypothetical protein